MASPPNDKRWLDVLQNCKDYYYDFIEKIIRIPVLLLIVDNTLLI